MRKYIYVTATEEDIGKDIIDFVKEQIDLEALRKEGKVPRPSILKKHKKIGESLLFFTGDEYYIQRAGRRRIYIDDIT